jgi:hypothetical protein
LGAAWVAVVRKKEKKKKGMARRFQRSHSIFLFSYFPVIP